MLLIYLSCAWIIGILLGARLSISAIWLLLALLPASFILVFRRRKKAIITLALLILVVLGGMIRYQSSLPVIAENQLQFYNDQTAVELKGIVSQAPDVRDKSTHIYLSVSEVRDGGEWKKVDGLALLFVLRYPEYSYGDVLTVNGKLETPQAIGEFDYQGYLANQGIYSTMLFPEIKEVEPGKGFRPLAWVYSLRNRLSQTMAEVLPEPQASLAQGMILGIRSNIPQPLQDSFMRSGTTHIIVISGSQFNIVAGIIVATGLWLFGKKRYLYIWLALAAIWVYALLTGMSPPVIRSAIMVSLFLLADLLGRQRSAMTVLAFAAAVMVAFTPQLLRDASFQLTFMATLGMVLIAPRLQSLGRRAVGASLGEEGFLVSTANWVSDSFFVTIGVTIAILPILVYYFGFFSLVSPLATLLVLPALPGLIYSGAMAAVIGVFALPIGQVIGWLAWLFASYMLVIIKGFADIPMSSVKLEINPVWLWVYFAVLAIILWLTSRRKAVTEAFNRAVVSAGRIPGKWIVIPLLIVAILTTTAAATMPDNKLHVNFLDVGQGDAILIRTPVNQDILVDGGPSPQAISSELGRRLPFWDRTIELMVLTHQHADHLTGLLETLRRYKVKQVLVLETDAQSPQWDEWLDLIQKRGIKSTFAQAGQVINLGTDEVTIEVINPLPDSTVPDMDNGIVLKLICGKVSFLLTSDISQEAELDLITRRADLTGTVLKVSHHGSNYSNSAEFLAVVDPELAVISVGADNQYGHPGEETLDRLIDRIGLDKIYRTDENGTVEFITDGERLWVKAERK
ncbi:MAG: DNA internalization-related competence protein ComEC/Rec2 [Dehalococcoidales bacterium]|nr:DNA internalization-related competence protein ComEC/Rec2 [Dehalococcoidales bacterium]